ncbi:MAG: phosphotransferase [Spirochaetaceae bacterium]|nr:phosphotransferase [Spirochaetaceae bacterium]
MTDAIRFLAGVARDYSLRPLSMSRVYAGCGTRNWSLRTEEGRFFVKEYPRQANAEEERQALELAVFARDCGIPTPRVIATHSEDLICTSGDTMFALFEWADGCTATRSLSPEQMAQAGGVLGDIHRHFSTIESPLPSETSRWLGFDAADKLREVERYVEIIRRKAEPDDFDRRTLPLLIERQQLVREVPRILQALPSLTTQVIHSDYGLPNVMFRDGRISAVVDFQPPKPFLIAYEVGRVAFAPENFTSSGWIDKASVLIREYCRAHRVSVDDIGFAPHVWLVQLIRSMYGVKQHYTRPVELQESLDRFWFQRAHAARTLFANLATLEETLNSVWETSAGDGRTG